MACELIITRKAEQDLDEIVGYIVNELCNAPAAVRLIDEIEKRYRLLAQNPNLYGECQQPLLKAGHYHKVVVGGYLMIYRADTEKTSSSSNGSSATLRTTPKSYKRKLS